MPASAVGWVAAIGCALLCAASPVLAQSPQAPAPAPQSGLSEDLEPRIVGRRGRMSLGISGFAGWLHSSEDAFPAHYIVQVDAGRFLTDRVAARLSLAGSGQFNVDADDLPQGRRAPALHASGGIVFYFTPGALVSFYAGPEYSLQLTQRDADGSDAGSVLGKAGLEAAVSSRATLFLEAGYGVDLTKGEEEETVFRGTGRIGLRISF